jgi:hypothetical protein
MYRLMMFLGVSVLALALLAPLADATQVIYRTPRQLGEDAALVVDGRVTNVRAYWNETQSKIFTEATVHVGGTHKGDAGSTVRIVQLGGVVDNVRMTVHGALQWTVGEEVLLFLEPSVPGAYQVAGFSQGKYRIERDRRSGRPFVQQVLSDGAELVDAPDASRDALARAAQPPKLALDKFLDDVFGRK